MLIYERARVPMRDGIELDAILFRHGDGQSAPTLLMRSPYGIDLSLDDPDPLTLLTSGYNIVQVACRGTYGSEGTFRGASQELEDGFDTVEWIIAQPWSEAAVGTFGLSYIGMTQWAIAASKHPALRSLAPMVTSANWYRAPWYHASGALSLSLVSKWHAMMAMAEQMRAVDAGKSDGSRIQALAGTVLGGNEVLEHTPIIEHPAHAHDPRVQEIFAHPDYTDYWDTSDFTPALSTLTAPVLMITGWFDLFISESLPNFETVTGPSAAPAVREYSRLVVGPWMHIPGDTDSPVDFGPLSTRETAELTGEHLRHYAATLPIGDPGPAHASPVKIFVMGINRWREEEAWPLPDTSYETMFFRPGHGAGGGSLAASPDDTEERLEYDFDPKNPVPTRGGAHLMINRQWGLIDQRDIQERGDILSFVTEPLTSATEVTGHSTVKLFVSSSAKDTDFTAKLVDVHEDGLSLSVTDGIVRMRYRNGVEAPELIEPGEAYEIEIRLDPTSYVFAAGHRLRVDVSSSNFPRFDRNTNTGGPINEESLENALVAHNSIHLGGEHASSITLPIIRR